MKNPNKLNHIFSIYLELLTSLNVLYYGEKRKKILPSNIRKMHLKSSSYFKYLFFCKILKILNSNYKKQDQFTVHNKIL